MHAITLFFQVFGLDSSGIADEEDLCRYSSGYPGIFPDWVFRWQPRIPFPCSFGFPGSLSSGIAGKEISAAITLCPGHFSGLGVHAIPLFCLVPGLALTRNCR